MKMKKMLSALTAAAMLAASMTSLCAYADDSAAALAAEKTIDAAVDTVYTAADLCPDGASYLKTNSTWSEVDSTNYSSFGVDFGDITSYTTYAVKGLNAELNFDAPVDGIYQINLLTATDYWWQYPAVYVGGTSVANGTDGGFANKSELASTIATFDGGKAAIAKAKVSLSEGDNAIRITSGGSYEGLTGLVAVKVTLLSKSTFTTDEIIKGDNITRGTGRASYCHTVAGGFTATDAYTGEIAEVFGDAANIGDKYNNYTDDTATYNLKVEKAGKYKVYVLGVNGVDTMLTYTDKNGTAATATATTAWTSEYWNNAVFTGGDKSVYAMACEVELEATTYTVSLDNASNGNYFTDFVALGMKLVEEASEEPTVIDGTIAVLKTFSGEAYEGEATALTATFEVPADTSVAKITVAEAADTTNAVSMDVVVTGATTVVYGIVVDSIVTADALTAFAE